MSNRIWGRSCWIHVAETPACPGSGEDQCSPVHLFTAGTKAFHINLISADAQNLHNLQKLPWICRLLVLKAKSRARLVARGWAVTGSDGYCFVWGFLCVTRSGRDAQTSAPELCEAVNDDKLSAARGGCCLRLSSAEQMAVKEEVLLLSIGFLDPRATGSLPKMQEPWHSCWLLTQVVRS